MKDSLKSVEEQITGLHTRVDGIEGVLGGTMNTPGLVHIQQQIAHTVFGKEGMNGLVKDVQNLKTDRARALAYIAGGTAVGSAVSGFLIWLLSSLHTIPTPPHP